MSAEPRKPKFTYAPPPAPKKEPRWKDPARELPVPLPPPPRTAKKPGEHVSPVQVARLLGVHVSTIYRLILTGKIPARRIGGRRFVVRWEEAVRFLEGDPVVPRPRIEWPPRDDRPDPAA